MTFAEISEIRRISKASAVKLVRRHGWRRQRDNQGQVRALVPRTWLRDAPKREGDSTSDSPAYSTPDSTRDNRLVADAVAGLRDAIIVLKERAERAEARADAAEARADEERKKTAAVEKDRDQLLAHHNRIALEVEALRQADRERRAAGRVARIRAAWRGE